MTCVVCFRESRGFGWFNTLFPIGDPRRSASYVRFCSKHCQDLFVKRRRLKERGMVDPTDLEKAAMTAALGPLGEYVAEIGMDRPLAAYGKEEVMILIEVVVTAYQDHMFNADGEIPF